MIPETTRDVLLQAIERFDQEGRNTAEWLNWPQPPGSHHWAISHNGRLYPVKQIISMATGQPTSGFSGGDEANGFARKYGFTVVPLEADANGEGAILEQYAAKFAKLHAQTGEAWWPAATLHRAPHKPLLLLSVLDLVSSGHIRSNQIDLGPGLRERFRTYWSIVMPADKRPNPGIPFRHLSGDGFWHLDGEPTGTATTADEQQLDAPGVSPVHARVDAELFELIQHEDARRTLSELLVNTYFAPEVRDSLRSLRSAGEVSFWWVNQGSTYKQEKAGAYLWAPRTGKSNVAFGHWTNVSRVRPGDIVLHYANNEILAVSRVSEPPIAAPRPNELPAETWETDGYFARVTPYGELNPPLRRADIPHEWRVEEAAGPFTQDANVKQGYLFPLSAEFVGKLAQRFPQLAELVDQPLPQRSSWLFQANPNFYNLADELKKMRVGQEDDWTVSRYKDRIHPGDRALLWQGGPQAGIYASVDITSQPFRRTEVADWMLKRDGSDAKPDTGVRYKLARIFNPPIVKAVLQQHPVLKNLMVLRAPTGTNFAVSEQEWNAIEELIGGNALPPPDYFEPELEQIRSTIWAKGLRFSERTLRRYHYSLKTHGFVILSGVSGGGKTQLARGYAEAVGAEWLVVPVAPNWNTNEDLLGFFNPVHKVYVDTSFSHFLRRAEQEHQLAIEAGRTPRPFHVVLDEMNLARVEQYFAKFLSAMELRSSGEAEVEVAPGELIGLTPNLMFVGTVNVDETTHGFANKVYDRAQLVEVEVPRELIVEHLAGKVYQQTLLEFWDKLQNIAPFAFRVLDEIDAYVSLAGAKGTPWQEALDDQLLQKVLPKLGGADDKVGATLDWLAQRTDSDFPLTHRKVAAMAARCHEYGFASYF